MDETESEIKVVLVAVVVGFMLTMVAISFMPEIPTPAQANSIPPACLVCGGGLIVAALATAGYLFVDKE